MINRLNITTSALLVGQSKRLWNSVSALNRRIEPCRHRASHGDCIVLFPLANLAGGSVTLNQILFSILTSASALRAGQTNKVARIITELKRATIIADRGRKPGVAIPGSPARNADSEPTSSLSLDCTLLLPNPLERRSTETVVLIPLFGWCRPTASRKIQTRA